jgi:hypothetical protein
MKNGLFSRAAKIGENGFQQEGFWILIAGSNALIGLTLRRSVQDLVRLSSGKIWYRITGLLVDKISEAQRKIRFRKRNHIEFY